MKAHGQLARAIEIFSGPIDFETLRLNWQIHLFYLSSNYFLILIMIVEINVYRNKYSLLQHFFKKYNRSTSNSVETFFVLIY